MNLGLRILECRASSAARRGAGPGDPRVSRFVSLAPFLDRLLLGGRPRRRERRSPVMGDLIRKDSAADDIFADVDTTLARARARGDRWQALAEEHLAEISRLIDATRERRKAAGVRLAVTQAALAAAAMTATRAVGKVSDLIWNEVGRPARD